MVGDSVSAVSDLMVSLQSELDSQGALVEWHSTGGGCMAVRVSFGPAVGPHHVPMYEVLIVGREDVLGDRDYRSDDAMSGFNAGLYVFGPDGEPLRDMNDSSILLYETAQDAGDAPCWIPSDPAEPFKLIDMATEVTACVSAVRSVVALVVAADKGRAESHGRPMAW